MKKIYCLLIIFNFLWSVKAQVVNFNYSTEFKSILVNTTASSSVAKDKNGNNIKIDINDDKEIQLSEALNVYQLNIDNYSLNMTGPFGVLHGIDGISYFTNLIYLNCRSCSIDNLDVTQLKNLVELNCDYNFIKNLNVVGLTNLKILNCKQINDDLDLTGLTNLEYLDCNNSTMLTLDLSQCPNLITLKLSFINSLKNLSVSGLNNLQSVLITGSSLINLSFNNLPNLKILRCSETESNYQNVSKLELSGLNNLEELYCSFNKITSLNLIGSDKLKKLECNNNSLTGILNLSDKKDLKLLKCQYNQISGLLVKNGYKWTDYDIYFFNNPNLKYICAEDNQYNFFQNKVYYSGMSSSTVGINSYCTFTPGGIFYTIQGNSKLDSNNNECDTSDINFPNVKLNITDGTTTGVFISNSTGNYSIPAQTGTHTITPVLENSAYFNVSPTTIGVTFPTQASPFTQDFCVMANGSHPDLEVTLLPLQPARPGFDTKYKIVYKNKGNTTQLGSVNLTFNDAVLDLVVANPITSTQTANNLSWDFINLKPFESKEIIVTLNVNTQTETPAVNNGDVLAYTAKIVSSVIDETPKDNTFTLNQTVVGSFDPNDKTCLEGITITPALIGEYVHYMIRFENTGNYAAQNIVVKDMIDLSKFDISTLVPTNASHSYTTKISDGNKVEFIFENINLPFDDANNDGYIAFKIKTKPTLVLGDSFTNDASIYFDYNFPIITNKATSTFKTLGTQDFEFSNYFTVYPNPVNEILNIVTTNEIEVKSIAVYNILGQLVLAFPNVKVISKIDVSNLKTGNYFIKINSDKGSSSMKFIKK
ncbi:T9SS type A sorting domain-containing protein [Flavobacterium sp. ZB4P13]|uniref:DUF7619 domain-containing protein n=1 Tax=Flavobacterium sp. ZB4P13 TaxID=3401728 RepID=UPI003AB03298